MPNTLPRRGNPGRLGNLCGGACRRRRRRGQGFDLTDGGGNLPANQIHPADEGDPSLNLGQLILRQDALEHSTCRSEADDDDVLRVRDVVAEKGPHDAELHFLSGPPVRAHVAAHAGDTRGKVDLAIGVAFQVTPLNQPCEGSLADLVALFGQMRDPKGGVAGIVAGLRYFGEDGVEQFVPQRCRVGDDELINVGIDAICQRQVHQRRSGESNGAGVQRESVANLTVIVVEDQ